MQLGWDFPKITMELYGRDGSHRTASLVENNEMKMDRPPCHHR
jgi:hypothetical protein